MLHRFVIGLLYAVEIAFFVGLAGCALVVIISWITILKAGFSHD